MINIAAKSAAAIEWAIRHWGEAHTLSITLRGLDKQEWESLDSRMEKIRDLLYNWYFAQSCQKLPLSLQSMALHLQEGSCNYCSYTRSWVYAYLSIFQPEVLCLAGDTSLCCPTMTSLKHLRMDVKAPAQIYYIAWADRFPNLESLTLCSDMDPNAAFSSYSHFKMDLQALVQLQSIKLQLLVPDSLSVPQGCRVHLVHHDVVSVSKTWHNGLADVSSTCGLYEQMTGVQHEHITSSMLRCLQSMTATVCPQLRVLKLHCKCFGSERDAFVVGDTLPSLQTLDVTAEADISLSFGAKVSLQVLSADAGGALFLDSNDMWAFTRRLERFNYRFKECCRMTQMWMYHLQKDETHPMVWQLDWKDRSKPAAFVALKANGCVVQEEHCDQDCGCGVCVDCVRRLHMPSSGHRVWPFVGLF